MSEMEIILVDKKDRSELKIGDEVKDFRGNEWKIFAIHPPGTSAGGMNGKVSLQDSKKKDIRLFFTTVIDAEFSLRETHQDAPLTDDEAPKFGFDRTMAKEKGYDE